MPNIKYRYRKWILKYKEEINTVNTFATLLIVVVSVFMIIVTYKSARISEKLGNIELYLLANKEKQEILEQKRMAEKSLDETKRNKEYISARLSDLKTLGNRSEYVSDLLDTVIISQAIETNGFGSDTIRKKMPVYLHIIQILKDDKLGGCGLPTIVGR